MLGDIFFLLEFVSGMYSNIFESYILLYVIQQHDRQAQ